MCVLFDNFLFCFKLKTNQTKNEYIELSTKYRKFRHMIYAYMLDEHLKHEINSLAYWDCVSISRWGVSVCALYDICMCFFRSTWKYSTENYRYRMIIFTLSLSLSLPHTTVIMWPICVETKWMKINLEP